MPCLNLQPCHEIQCEWGRASSCRLLWPALLGLGRAELTVLFPCVPRV